MPLSPTDRPNQDALNRYAELFNESLTLRHFGSTIGFPSVDRVRVTLPVVPGHRGGIGTEAVNGGVLAALFDLAIGCTAALVDPRRRSATMQLSMNFERAVLGDVVTAEAWVDRAGSKTGFSSAVIMNALGEVCARAQGVIRLMEVQPDDVFSPGAR